MPAHVFPLKNWEPDKAPIETGGVSEAMNVVPGPSGYEPFRTLVTVTTALDAYARGAIQARDEDNAVHQYAGNASKLYRNASDTWTDSSKALGYSTGTEERWEFTKWRNTMIATNWNDSPQTITLGGTTFADLTTALKFRHVATVRDFVVAGNTNDATDGNVPWRVRWSAFQDPTDWTVSASTLADYEDLPQRQIQRVFGGEYGIIFQDEVITRMTFVGAPLVFQFDEVISGVGLLAPGGAVEADDTIFFLSSRGFYSLTNGTQLTRIGEDRVDDYVLNDIDRSYLYRMSSAADPQDHRVYWAYPGAGSTNGVPNKIICYDYGRNQWSIVETEIELIWESSGSSVTVEGLDSLYADLDSITISLDDTSLTGGQRQLAAFYTDDKSGFFNGTPLNATITTREYMFDGDRRTKLYGFRPMVEGSDFTLTARVGNREDMADTVTWSESLSPNTGGRVPCRVNSRYHRIELSLSGEWSKAFGIIVDKKDVKSGGRRG